ncbi:hypothetical protein D3C84_815340 [compost metagenome]
MAAPHQDMQTVLAQWPLDKLQLIANIAQPASQVIAGDELVLQGQLDPPGLQHARGAGETADAHLVQQRVAVELGGIGIATHHRDALDIQIGQLLELDGAALALQQADAVDQIGLGEVTEAGTLLGVPGIDQHIVVGPPQPAHRPRPGHLGIRRGIPGTIQRAAHQIRGHAVIQQGLIGERRPGVGHQTQGFARHSQR